VSKKIGDVSRRRRLTDPLRIAYYALYRSHRFARRFGGGQQAAPAQPSPQGTPAVGNQKS
jgi:hypothetical protein